MNVVETQERIERLEARMAVLESMLFPIKSFFDDKSVWQSRYEEPTAERLAREWSERRPVLTSSLDELTVELRLVPKKP